MKTENELRRERRLGWIITVVLLSMAGAAYVTLKFVTPRSRVVSGSMSPTIHQHDHVFVNRLAYRFGAKPRVGDIAAFRDGKSKFIHRVVAGAGDTVQMRDKVLFLNGKRRDEPYAVCLHDDIPTLRTFGPITVPAGTYFFLGDNRDNANDSRFRGTIPEDRILARMFYVLHIGRCDE